MTHRRHIYAKASYISKARICAYPQSDHALTHWKCVLICCAKYPCVNLTDQETDDQYYDISTSIRFHIYHLILCCTTQGRLPLDDRKICRTCKQDSDSEQPTIIYTRKYPLMTEENFLISIQVSILQKFRSSRFTFHMQKN